MYSKEEIGSFPDCGRELNDAYALYASIYLDYVDGSLSHFICRGVNTAPIENIASDDEQVLAKAYMEAAFSIARSALSSAMSPEDKLKMLSEYPVLLARLDGLSFAA